MNDITENPVSGPDSEGPTGDTTQDTTGSGMRGGPRGRGRGPHGGPRHFHGGRPGGRGRGRAARGDVRSAVLLLLADEPMHGYQLMQAIAERTQGGWTPSPGVIYPTIAQLEEEGLVTVTESAGRRIVALTDAGRHELLALRDQGLDPFAGNQRGASGVDLRGQMEQLVGAVRTVGRNGTEAQRQAAAQALATARRSIYLLLAEGEGEGTD